jgi:2',3'-cyclic-nucleotide 2'-phosphodiesterase
VRFLIFGDVVGRPGREAVSRVLPALRREHQPDSVIINIENIAHGAGVSPETWAVAKAWEADVYTTGDHAWDNAAGISLLENSHLPIIRPANYPGNVPGRGWQMYTNGAWQIAVINLQGQVFFRNDPENPFHYLDAWLERREIQQAHIVLIDFQAEATSEKRGLGWYVDGRVSALWGTHTHVPTADAQILPKGCGYITDVGMNGTYHSVIGIDRAGPLRRFTSQLKARKTFDDTGPLEVGALLLDIDPKSGKTTNIVHIRKIVNATDT